MVTCKVSDYLTLSVLPGSSGIDAELLFRQALVALYLDDLWDKGLFEYMCENKYYSSIWRFSDIQIKIGSEDKFLRNGICFEFSGHGMDYYTEYLSTHFNKVTLRTVARRFVALSSFFPGIKTTSSRFDVAFDNIISKGVQEEALLTLERVEDCINRRAFVSKFRKSDATSSNSSISPFYMVNPSECDESLAYLVIESRCLSTGQVGKTVELGKRKSNSFVRIYDKLVEQSVKGADVSDISHWVRFEIEFKHSAACSVFMLYATSKDDADFANKIKGKALELIRFVDLDRSRLYNCTVCDWWIKFLDNVKPYHLICNKPNYNKYVRALNHQKRRNAASLVALLLCHSGNARSILLEGINHGTKTTAAIINDFNAVRQLDGNDRVEYVDHQLQKLTGYDFWQQFYPDCSDDEFYHLFESDVELLLSDFESALSEVGITHGL